MWQRQPPHSPVLCCISYSCTVYTCMLWGLEAAHINIDQYQRIAGSATVNDNAPAHSGGYSCLGPANGQAAVS